MISEITGALTGLKGAMDIAKGLNAVADTVALNDAKIGLQSAILEAQSSLLAAQEAQTVNLRRIEELEQEIMRLNDWSAERERYHLVDVDRGAFAYMPKPGRENEQPAHWLCTRCFDQAHRSFLQFKGQSKISTSQASYGCDRCYASFTVHFRRKPTYPGQSEAL